MTNIIVAFSKRENAVNIRNILTRSGVKVSAVCLTGSKVLQHTELWSQGIIICGTRLQDMTYTELKELLPDGFEILLIAPSDRWIDSLPEGIVGLPSPLKAYDLLNTLEMMSQAQESRRRKRGCAAAQQRRTAGDRAGKGASYGTQWYVRGRGSQVSAEDQHGRRKEHDRDRADGVVSDGPLI